MIRYALIALGLSGCLVPTSSKWDAVSSEVVHLQLDPLFVALDKGDVPTLVDMMDDSVIVYDVDVRGVPLVAHERVQAMKVFEQLAAQRQVAGGTVKSNVQAATCHATKSMGFCAIEYTRTVTYDADRIESARYRATMVARQVEGRWLWVQWNNTPLDRPAAVASAAPVVAQPEGVVVEAVDPTKP